MNNTIDERGKEILWAIIKSYIDSKGPIGSRTVTKRYSLGLSPATIRNSMADLEDLGYIIQPHTSAGRIPTERGYRLYVNTLLKRHNFSAHKALLKQLFKRLHSIEKDLNRLPRETSKTLSVLSSYLGIATPPKEEQITLSRIKFIKHEKNKVLSFLISEEGIVKNRIIHLKKETFSQKQLDKAANYLNSELKGLTLGEIKARIISRIYEEKEICDKLILDAIMLLKKIISLDDNNSFYLGEISGACYLPDFANMKQIKELFKAIEDKHLMVKLLDKMSKSSGIQVFIGSENHLSEMRDLSMVGSTYNDGHRVLGTIGVIGPTRMNYDRVIPIVDLTAKTLTRIFSEIQGGADH